MGGCEDPSSASSPTQPPSLHDDMLCANGLIEQHFDINTFLNGNAKTVTETVKVPSSEHVAEIVGRQGNECTAHAPPFLVMWIASFSLVCVCTMMFV